MTEKQTSRSWIIDAVELCTNCIAMNSHLQEVVNSYGKNEKVTEEDYNLCLDIIDQNNGIRRDTMTKIMTTFGGDSLYWCALKHAMASYGYSTELLYTDTEDKDFVAINAETSDVFYSILSRFINAKEIVTCGRCLNDII